MSQNPASPINGTAPLDKMRAEAVRLLKSGKAFDAAVRLRAALALAPQTPDLHNLLGTALANHGDYEGARSCFLHALLLKPDFADAMVNLGHHLRKVGQVAEAVKHYRDALTIKPDWADVYNNLGLALRSMGKLAEAESQFRQALQKQPYHSESRNNLGVILADQGKWPEAAAIYQQVLRQQPKASGTHNNLGVILLLQGKIREAIDRFQTALNLRPNYADASNNLGNALLQEGRLEEAEKCLRRALELKPDLTEACNNLARVLVRQGKVDEAIVHFQQALRLQPNFADAHKNLAWCWLLTGDLAQGWAEQEWYYHSQAARFRKFEQPRWQGENFAGQALFLHTEQKLEDTLQFIRYVAMVSEHGGTVIVECPPALAPLVKSCPSVDRLIPQGHPLPEFDKQASLTNLPGIMQSRLDTIPAQVPYLFADEERVERWSQELRDIGKFKVGIAWQANPQDIEDRQRSLPLTHFGRLAQIEGVRLVSLQKGPRSDPWANIVESWKMLDLSRRLNEDQAEAILDIAAIMKNLDVVITPDNELAHLAGALGVPVWVILPKAPHWRWLLDRDDSPWYPTARLFRQKEHGKWDDVFESLALELQRQPPLEKPEFYLKTGRALLSAGKLPEAVSALRRGLELAPGDSALHTDLGMALMRQELKEEALASFERAVTTKPDNLDALFQLGNLLREMQRMDEAEARFRQGLHYQPNMPGLLNHLGLLLLWQAKHTEAEECFRRAARVVPDSPGPFLNNLGILLEQENRLDEAVAVFHTVLAYKKEDAPDAHKNLGMIHLVRGDYARGWAEYEWRLQGKGRERPFEQPRWDGQPLHGKPILIWTEQGLGDTLQFIRYASLVKARGGFVIVECRNVLKQLLSRCPGMDLLLTQGSPLPDFTCQAALLSLPHILHTGEETVPADVPYLSAEPGRIAHWRKELDGTGEFKVGIVWQGSPSFGSDRHRSIPLAHYEPLASVPGVRLVSLQKGYGLDQLKELAGRWNILDLSDRLDVEGGAFLDSAAVIKNLDLVITSDTSIVHLAGALGAPVWLALGQGCDWRWLREREDSPWYPTMRLFRQRHWGDWTDVFERMAGELRMQLGRKVSSGPILAEISPAELLDKISILEIKRERAADERERVKVWIELGSLLSLRARVLKPSPMLDSLALSLKNVNRDLWQLKNDICHHETHQDFGERFTELARSMCLQNGERSQIKRKIDELSGLQAIDANI